MPSTAHAACSAEDYPDLEDRLDCFDTFLTIIDTNMGNMASGQVTISGLISTQASRLNNVQDTVGQNTDDIAVIASDYLTSGDLDVCATEEWVLDQGFAYAGDVAANTDDINYLLSECLTSVDLEGYATEAYCDAAVDGHTHDSDHASCADWLAAGYTADGTYTITPDGWDSYDVICDMTTDGGGWTRVVRWNAEDDGDSLLDFEDRMTEEINDMGDWHDSGNYIWWGDGDTTADVMSFSHEVLTPNGGEVRATVDYYGWSFDDAATYFYVEAGGAYEDLFCKESHYTFDDIFTDPFTAEEAAYRPYVCADQTTASVTFTVDETFQIAAPAEVTGFYITSFAYDNTTGDYHYLYDFEVWVR